MALKAIVGFERSLRLKHRYQASLASLHLSICHIEEMMGQTEFEHF